MRRVVIDTDPGLDDAVALWLALGSGRLAVEAVHAVGGNVGLARTAANAAAIVSLAGSDAIVRAGEADPLRGRHAHATRVHGEDGLGSVRLPQGRAIAAEGAVDGLARMLRAGDAPTLVGIGPVTNLARAFDQAGVSSGGAMGGVDEIVLMAGSDGGGNLTARAEFNAGSDPEALAAVVSAGPMVTFATLELTAQAPATEARVARLAAGPGGACRDAAVALMRATPEQGGAGAGEGGRPVHDACAVAWLLAPALFTWRLAHVEIGLAGEMRGATVFSAPGPGRAANARLLETIDADGLFGLIGEALARLP